jgi:outer membrane protein assembly factor BamB
LGDPDFAPHCLVRAHDLGTGSIVWQAIHATTCSARAVASDGKRVIVAAQGGPAVDDFLVQSYDADTGQFLWEDRTFVSTGFDNAAVAVDIERRLAFVAGWVRWVPGRQNQEAFLVRAYDTASGILRWEDQFPSASVCICQAKDVVVDGGRVIAVGAGPGTWLVRAYEARHGDLLWSDEFAPIGGIGPNPFDAEGALAIAMAGGRVFVGGSGVNASGDADLILRTYDAK